MNCTDCPNTVPLISGQHPKYVRPTSRPGRANHYSRIEAIKPIEPLCRVCWEKATEQCQEHDRIPNVSPTGKCWRPLFTCSSCDRRVCADYKAEGDSRCKTCISEPEDD